MDPTVLIVLQREVGDPAVYGTVRARKSIEVDGERVLVGTTGKIVWVDEYPTVEFTNGVITLVDWDEIDLH